MAKKVPFLGEERIARADDPQSEAKKTRGRAIDEVLSTAADPSSWDDVVVVKAPAVEPSENARPHASIPKPTKRSSVAFTPGVVFKKTPLETELAATKGSSFGATIDWIPINNGHALRINVCGDMDQGIRAEWVRLLEETANNGVGQFEFNLMQAPTLSLTGLGMLLLFKEQKGSERGDIKLCHCNKDVWQLLQWAGMDRYFVIQGAPNMS